MDCRYLSIRSLGVSGLSFFSNLLQWAPTVPDLLSRFSGFYQLHHRVHFHRYRGPIAMPIMFSFKLLLCHGDVFLSFTPSAQPRGSTCDHVSLRSSRNPVFTCEPHALRSLRSAPTNALHLLCVRLLSRSSPSKPHLRESHCVIFLAICHFPFVLTSAYANLPHFSASEPVPSCPFL